MDVARWARETGQALDAGNAIIATFVIDLEGQLWIADRHSEHVHCALGKRVLSAGEVTFRIDQAGVMVVAVTNQSTGYCPEPESWRAVATAFDAAGLARPAGFTTAFEFRRCETCRTINLIIERCFECAACGSPLPARWNCAAALGDG